MYGWIVHHASQVSSVKNVLHTDAADTIAKFITQGVVANSRGAGKGLRSYFDAVPRANVDTDDLYDSP
jgi:hypothetical protein